MRRALGSLLLSLSLVFATISWSGFILTRTVFDPGRSERLADELFDNEEVRAVAIDRLAEAINNSIPPEISITDEQLETASELVLEDPRVEQLVKDQLVLAHQNALNGVDEPVQVDATVVGQAGRDAAIAQQPALDAILPEVPPVEITLPTTGLSWLGTVNSYVRRISFFAGLAAVAGISISIAISSNRPRVLRRVAYWAFGAAAFWIVAAIVAPWVVNLFSPSSLVLVTAAINVFFGAMIPPAITMAVFGVILFGLSVFLPRLTKQRTAGRIESSHQRRNASAGYNNRRSRSSQQLRRPTNENQSPRNPRQGQGQAAFDNQRLQRQVDASRAEAERGFLDDRNADQQPVGFGQNRRSETYGEDDDWFELPSEQPAQYQPPGQQQRPGTPWEDSPTIRQQNF